MNKIKSLVLGLFSVGVFVPAGAETVAPTTGPGIIQLSELDGVENITCGAGQSVRLNKSTDNNPITLLGSVYESGIGTHAPSIVVIDLKGSTSFYTLIGVDDEADLKPDHGIIDFVVTAYGETAADATNISTGHLDRQKNDAPVTVSIQDVTPYKYIKIELLDGDHAWADHVDLADARLTYEGEKPCIIAESDMYDVGVSVKLPETPSIDGATIIPLSSMDLGVVTTGWGTVRADRSVDDNPIRMKGVRYESGIGLHATAKVVVKLNGSTPKFHALLGLDDEIEAGIEKDASLTKNSEMVAYKVLLRRQGGATTTVMEGKLKFNDPEPVTIDLDNLTEYKYLIIEMDQNGTNAYDHVDLANAYFEFVYQNSNEPELVPESVLAVGLDAATTVFSQPGIRFMHKLRSLDDDAKISVGNLPVGLTFNEKRNLVEGIVEEEGVYTYDVKVVSDGEEVIEPITLTVSSSLQQPVPFMGWLSWNSIEGNISDQVIKTVADQMEKKGLIEAGYTHLVIDDLWHASARAASGKPLEDPAKFPNGIKESADYVHSKGMKFGMYSDAAEHTCAGAYGGYGYEKTDAKQYAEWGVDILKYDYCGAPADVETAKKRYKAIGDALKNSGRNIILYICEWGPREPWKWGSEVGGSCWRCTFDTRDCWEGVNGGIGIVQSIAGMKDLWIYNGVNRFNDADMMCVGINGTGKSSSHLCLTGPGMTKDEYRTQMALWCMWSSPLTLSNDMTKTLSATDLAIMTNAELIALNQDRMGQAGETVFHDPADCLILAKDLENGDVAVSVTNLSSSAKKFTVDFSQISALDPDGEYFTRDVVNHEFKDKSVGTIDFGRVKSHATAVYRLSLSDPESNIGEVAANSLDGMTVSSAGLSVKVCLPGTEGAPKRMLLSDLGGRIVDSAKGSDECFTFRAPAPGVYVVNTICAGRSMSRIIRL
ncbi:MAG: NPCBM/NEW2 domain-containing protein [Muribaculaceae bacterium]|nr:NPCBM/NEW2 domain-containing protein [Muribaculaceae bacterium]